MRDWNDLQYFLAVQRGGTLAAAAKVLKVDATTAGRKLSQLEAALGAPLFERDGVRLVPSNAGSAIRELVEAIEERVAAVERRAHALAPQAQGPVRIAATEAMAIQHLLPNLATFRRKHPKLELEIVTGNAALNLTDRQADVAVRLVRPTQPGLVGRKAGEIGIAIYAAASYLRGREAPRLDDGLEGHDVIGYVAEASEWPEAKWVAEKAFAARIVAKVNSILVVAAAAKAGVGLAVLPCGIGDGEPGLRRVTPRVMSREIWLVFHRDLKATPKVRAALAMLSELFAKEEPMLRGKA